MAQRDNFMANGGTGQQGNNRRRPDWPGFAPGIQPGDALLPVQPNLDQPDARDVVIPPQGQPFDIRQFDHHALATLLGVQASMANPRIRMLVQTMFDNMLRASFKPVVSPPWITKPFVGMDFGGFVSDMTAALGGGWADITNGTTTLSFTMPQGRMGVVRDFSQAANTPDDWDNLSWRLMVNGVPVAPYNNITCQISSFPSPRQVQILVMPGATVSLQIRNASASDITLCGGSLVGWHWPVAVAGDIMNAHGQATVA